MKDTLDKILKKINEFSWKYPRAFLFLLGFLTGLLLAYIF